MVCLLLVRQSRSIRCWSAYPKGMRNLIAPQNCGLAKRPCWRMAGLVSQRGSPWRLNCAATKIYSPRSVRSRNSSVTPASFDGSWHRLADFVRGWILRWKRGIPRGSRSSCGAQQHQACGTGASTGLRGDSSTGLSSGTRCYFHPARMAAPGQRGGLGQRRAVASGPRDRIDLGRRSRRGDLQVSQ